MFANQFAFAIRNQANSARTTWSLDRSTLAIQLKIQRVSCWSFGFKSFGTGAFLCYSIRLMQLLLLHR